jgi:hypothetical protein
MLSVISKILNIYFTPFPYSIYNTAVNNGNMAWAGVGLGLINSQRLFWISNTGIILVIYNTNIYLDLILLSICGFLYTASLIRVLNLINYLNI